MLAFSGIVPQISNVVLLLIFPLLVTLGGQMFPLLPGIAACWGLFAIHLSYLPQVMGPVATAQPYVLDTEGLGFLGKVSDVTSGAQELIKL